MLHGRTESIDDLEEDFRQLIQRRYVTPGTRTVLAMADSKLFEVDELRAQVGGWESGMRIEAVFYGRKTKLYVLLTDVKPCLNIDTDIRKDRERSKSPGEMRVERLHSLTAGPLAVPTQVNCGFPRRKKVAKAERERERRRKNLLKGVTEVARPEPKPKRRIVPESDVVQRVQ